MGTIKQNLICRGPRLLLLNNKHKKEFKQFICFCLIGLINTAIHFIVFISLLKFIPYQSIDNFVGFTFGLLFSFFTNAKFTFKQKATKYKFLKMLIVSGSLSFIFGVIGDFFCLNPILTFVLYIIINPIFSFLFIKKIVFNE